MGAGQTDTGPTKTEEGGNDKPKGKETKQTGEANKNALTKNQGVAGDLHVDEKLHGDADKCSPD